MSYTEPHAKWPLPIIAAVVLSAALVAYMTRKFFFFSDDFLNFVIAVDMGFTRDYLARDVFGQFIPLYRFGFLAYWRLFGLHFWPFRICCILFGPAIILLAEVIARRWRVNPILVLPAAITLAASPIFVTLYQWPSAALSVAGSAISGLLMLDLATRADRLGWGRRIALAALFAAGLGLYPKTLFFVILLLALQLFVHTERRGLTFRDSFAVAGLELSCAAPVALVYVAVVYFDHYTNNVARPGFKALISFIEAGWTRGFLAGVFGIDRENGGGILIANLCVAGLLSASILRNRRTVILWLGFTAYFVVSIGTIGWNRAVPFGLEAAEIKRYYADILCYGVVFALVALAPRQNGRAVPPARLAWPWVSAATAVLAFHLSGAATRVPHLWYAGPEQPAAFAANVRDALSRLAPADTIANTVVPATIMPEWMFPLTQYEYVLPVFGVRGRVASPSQATEIFTETGTLKRLHP
jgi:hypothetical protein